MLNNLAGQQKDYAAIFGKDWQNAEEFLIRNRTWINPFLKKYDIGYAESMSVIFPELVRYSAIRDKMETALLKTLYVNLGKEYANFSIGHFQMKPSFAEYLGVVSPRILGKSYNALIRDSMSFENIADFRSAVVKDLEDPVRELGYLVVFIKICSKRFHPGKMTADERVKFISTAYNSGFSRQENAIKVMEDKKFFRTGMFSGEFYAYADVSLFWYNLHKADK